MHHHPTMRRKKDSKLLEARNGMSGLKDMRAGCCTKSRCARQTEENKKGEKKSQKSWSPSLSETNFARPEERRERRKDRRRREGKAGPRHHRQKRRCRIGEVRQKERAGKRKEWPFFTRQEMTKRVCLSLTDGRASDS